VITALLLASLEAKRKEEGHGNIRTVLSPAQIRSVTESSGVFKLSAQETRAANEGLRDGYWEVSDTLRKREQVLGSLKEQGVPEKELAAMVAMYDGIQAAVEVLDGEEAGVKSMDIWVAKFQTAG
jgi:hypothetical protein